MDLSNSAHDHWSEDKFQPAASPVTTTTTKDVPPKPACKFCKRPPNCPTCNTELSPPPKKGPTDIDGDVPDPYKQLPAPKHNIDTDSHPDFKVCYPPTEPSYGKFSVFAAGSIEMGAAIQWQPLLANYLCNLPITICNPRRGHWDPSITPAARDTAFRAQVEWELSALTACTVICFFFDHATMSPVTMCELGLWAHSGKVVVCCDRRFWKSGNVELVCERYGVPLVNSFAEMVPLVEAKLRTKGMMLDKMGNVTEREEERDEARSMSLEEAEEYCKKRTPARWGMAPDLKAMGQAGK